VQHTIEKISKQRLQLCFKIHFNRRFAHKVMGPQSCRNPNFGNFKTPIWSIETKWNLGVGPVARHRVYYKGEGGGFPKSELWWILRVRVCPWFVRAPKCSNYALTNLLFGLCRFVWMIELLVNFPSPHLGALARPLPSKCCEPGSTPQLLLLSLFSPWTRIWVH
jgi:hypothetical protein